MQYRNVLFILSTADAFLCIFLASQATAANETNLDLIRSDGIQKKKLIGLVKKHLKRLRKQEGALKLVGGQDEYEGNVEILHKGQWGAICDDEWDQMEADVICRQLGYQGVAIPTHNSHFGAPKRKYWMDNLFCDGNEDDIAKCRFDGWGESDCDATEAAGVKCHEPNEQNEIKDTITIVAGVQHEDIQAEHLKPLGSYLQVRLQGGRTPQEGRVEVKGAEGRWDTVCGQGWSIMEAIVVCRSLKLGYASEALQTTYFGGDILRTTYASVRCTGEEDTLATCRHDVRARGSCLGNNMAAVFCMEAMADLVIDHMDLMRTAHLEDRQMFMLQCAMEENCLASQAYEIQRDVPSWQWETRRLLKFTARILNAGTADFRPAIPKHLWEWHMCHMHYHSMEVFAMFDIYDSNMVRVAEGHKASFCLEDNQCLPGVEPRYACANFGDQGISVNCTDIYKYTVDCQWVDISDLAPGVYTLKVAVNPEFKIPEMTFANNAAYCQFYYGETIGTVTNCTIGKP